MLSLTVGIAESESVHNQNLISPQLITAKNDSGINKTFAIPRIIISDAEVKTSKISWETEISGSVSAGKGSVVEIKEENQKINIKVNEVIAVTSESVEIKDNEIYMLSENEKLKIKVLPIIISEKIKIAEPQEIQEIELKIKDEKPIYEIKSIQSINITEGNVNIEITNKISAETGEIIETQKRIKKNNLVVMEGEKDLPLIWDNKLVKLENISNKEIKREKLFVKSVKPIVKLEKIRSPVLARKEKLILQIRKECVFQQQNKLIAGSDNYDIVAVETDNIQELLENECVLKIADEHNKVEFIKYSKKILKSETEEKIRKLELKKSIYDVIEMPELKVYMAEDEWKTKEGQASPYQQFITLNDIKDEIIGLEKKQIYEKAKSFVWISDSVLHNKPEKWMLPSVFLDKTPTMESNPMQGETASDCSEQANTLVSMLRMSGVSAEDVRVALGKVNFNGNIGGHAWVEIKEDGKWMVLEATSGPFYDEEESRKIDRTGVSYDYWKYHEYPVEEVWMYYNDKYYTDEAEEVAKGWSAPAETSLDDNVDNVLKSLGRNFFQIIADWFRNLLG